MTMGKFNNVLMKKVQEEQRAEIIRNTKAVIKKQLEDIERSKPQFKISEKLKSVVMFIIRLMIVISIIFVIFLIAVCLSREEVRIALLNLWNSACEFILNNMPKFESAG